METIVPEARGRAEALRTYLAGGGPLTRSGRYTQGRLKNKTIEQAQVEFDRKWGGASGRIKDKYANMAGKGAMSPSERADYETRVAGVRRTPSPAPAPVAEAPNPNKNLPTDERMHAEGKINPAPILPRLAQTRPAEPVNFAYKPPAGTQVQSVGDGKFPANPRAAERQRQADEITTRAQAEIANPSTAPTKLSQNRVQSKDPVPVKEPTSWGAGDIARQAAMSGMDGPPNPVAIPQPAAGQSLPARVLQSIGSGKPVAKAAGVPGVAGSVGVAAPATPPPQAPPAIPQEPMVAGVAKSPPREIAFDGRRNLGDAEAADAGKAIGQRVNPVTGLPFGHNVGQALPAGANQAMRDAATASVARQAAATAAAPKPQPKPMVAGVTKAPPMTPNEKMWAGRKGYQEENRALEERQKAYASRPAKALPVNPTTDEEFQRSVAGTNFGLKAGPIKPLSELVKPSAPPVAVNRRMATPEEIAKFGVGSKPAGRVAGVAPTGPKTKFARRI